MGMIGAYLQITSIQIIKCYKHEVHVTKFRKLIHVQKKYVGKNYKPSGLNRVTILF